MGHNLTATLEAQAAEMGFNKAGLGNKEPSLLFLSLSTSPSCLGILKSENFIFQGSTLSPEPPTHYPPDADWPPRCINSWKKYLCCWYDLGCHHQPQPLLVLMRHVAFLPPTLYRPLDSTTSHQKSFPLPAPDSQDIPLCLPINIPVLPAWGTMISLLALSPSSYVGSAFLEVIAWVFSKSCSPNCAHS